MLQFHAKPYRELQGKSGDFDSMTIGELSRLTGVGVQTLRYYEREGLLAAPPRNGSGYRAYDQGALARMNFIRRTQDLGFTLKEIRELLALQDDQSAECADVRTAAESKLRSIEAKIADLQAIRTELGGLVASCQCEGPIAQCDLVKCLDGAC
jgi:MerR family transcriptional regulator, copper efflux regulator